VNLTGTTQTLELVTAAATALHYEVSWTDIDKTGATAITPGSAQGIISAIATTTIVAAPASATIYRVVTSLSARAVGGAQDISIQKDVAATNYSVCSGQLGSGESLHYEDASGWYTLDITGARKGIGATGANGTNGGGTVLGSGTSIVDFGSSGSTHQTLVVTGQAAILAGSLVYCWIKPEDTVDHTADEHIVESLAVYAASIVAGVGFTLHVKSTSEIISIRPEARRSRFSGTGQDFGPGQAARNNLPNLGGRTPLLKGKWSIGWLYTQ
jgi:hypothetical protein